MGPPDPSAHDQVHDWAAENGMQTVDVLQLGLSCPQCYSPIACVRHVDEPGWIYLTHTCRGKEVRVRVRDEHLIQRFPCEVDPPETETEREQREASERVAAEQARGVPGRRRSLREYAEEIARRVGASAPVDIRNGRITVNGLALDDEQLAGVMSTIDRVAEIEGQLLARSPTTGTEAQMLQDWLNRDGGPRRVVRPLAEVAAEYGLSEEALRRGEVTVSPGVLDSGYITVDQVEDAMDPMSYVPPAIPPREEGFFVNGHGPFPGAALAELRRPRRSDTPALPND